MGQIVAYTNANYTHPDATAGAWTNPTNAYADDGSYATRTGTTKNIWYGNLFGFDLSALPDNASVDSISLEAQWKNDAADTSGPVLGLAAYSGGAIVGTEATDTTGQTSDETLTKDPTGLTVAQIKATGATGFAAGVRFRRTDNTAHTASLDYVKATVNFTLALSGTAAVSGGGDAAGTIQKGGKGTALASAAGALVAVGLAAMLGIASITAGGALSATGRKNAQDSVAISAGGAQAAAGQKAAADVAAITGGGSLIASGEAGAAAPEKLKLGSDAVAKVYFGATVVDKVYMGSVNVL